MKFKPGQRVRVLSQSQASIVKFGKILGKEATFIDYYPCWVHPKDNCRIKPDGDCRIWGHHDSYLAPLTDPGFESFMERIQKPLTKLEAA